MRDNHPQRIKVPEPPGTMLKGSFETTKKLKLRSMPTDPAYLAMVRQCPCLRCGLDPCWEAAHVRMSSGARGKAGGMRKKPDDKYALPLCSPCHTRDPDSQHKVGELIFWHRVGLNPLAVCDRLHARRGDVVAMRAVIFTSIAERESITQWKDKP